MRINWRASSLLCSVCAVALACDEPVRGPVAPDLVSTAVTSARAGADLPSIGSGISEPAGLTVNPLVPPSMGAMARGHADIHGTLVQNVKDETYSFTADPADASPLANGQLEAHFLLFTSQAITVHAEVTCLSVVGTQAWIGARVKQFVVDGVERPERVGLPMVFRVQDGGEGPAATDLASLLFFGFPVGVILGDPTTGDLTYCSTRPAFPILLPSTIGNIQVTSN